MHHEEQLTIKKFSDYQKSYDWYKSTTNMLGTVDFHDNNSNNTVWGSQITELKKLPVFLRIGSPNDLRSYVGHPIYGVNTNQIIMKVDHSSTGAHQEDCNFCSVNWNIGPADVKWYFVESKYWGMMYRYGVSIGSDLFKRNWWPDAIELEKLKIPVSVVTQKPGDLIFTNIGTIHWVMSEGVSNNIAWNVAPQTLDQYNWAMERYEYNKSMNRSNVIPMLHLIWNLAKDAKWISSELFESIRIDLRLSLKRAMATLTYLKSINKSIEEYNRMPNEVYQTCCTCQIELFNYIFVEKNGKKTFCLKCVPNMDNVKVLEEFRLDQLSKIYDGTLKKIDLFGLMDIIEEMGSVQFECPYCA